MTTRTILQELEERGLVQNTTGRDELDALLSSGQSVSFYIGYDPTGTSLHVGSLVPTILMARLQRAGHKPYCLVGGATGMVGDPSGKSEERQLLDTAQLAKNVEAIRKQLEPFLVFGDVANSAVMVNNHEWFGDLTFLEFLRDVGKHLSVNYMMAKESVRSRLSDRDQGISYTEFSYMLLQAYDFHVLAKRHGCLLQAGGSDQWGNITAGIELHRRMGGKAQLHGLTAPLLLDSSGKKMGKTAAGTSIWLDSDLTSPYAFYQYWLNVQDADVERLLKLFSWRELDEIDELVRAHAEAPERREGQKALASDVTSWVHGEAGLRAAVAATQVMFGGSLADLTDADLAPLLADVKSSEIEKHELASGIELTELLARTELAKSKGAARRLISGGGVYVNNVREADVARTLSTADLATETMLVLRAGKKNYHIVKAS
jgi:tyrosyl-tRNA synthetase